MNGAIFGVISFLCLLALIVGLVKPQLLRLESRKRVFYIFGSLFIVFLVVGVAITPSSTNPSSNTQDQIVSQNKPAKLTNLGDQGYLRLPDVQDSSQVILLSPDNDVIFDKLYKALTAKDTIGLLELADYGVFGVSNGSKILVIDRAVGTTKVRIVEGVNPVDDDKVGMSGWVPSEWAVDK